MPFPTLIKDALNRAWEDNVPCLVGTVGKDGPNISPKGSLYVYDDDHFAYWERAKTTALQNLKHDKRVVVCYAKMGAKFGDVGGFMRFYGTAEIHESGPIKDAIFAGLTKREQEHEGADKGVGVLVKIERTADTRGRPVLR
jgi:general stress protein 26